VTHIDIFIAIQLQQDMDELPVDAINLRMLQKVFLNSEVGCSICCSPFFAVYEDILTPPLPLPYKGGECLRISICRGKRKPLPSLVLLFIHIF
jgi:hypothetical protein